MANLRLTLSGSRRTRHYTYWYDGLAGLVAAFAAHQIPVRQNHDGQSRRRTRIETIEPLQHLVGREPQRVKTSCAAEHGETGNRGGNQNDVALCLSRVRASARGFRKAAKRRDEPSVEQALRLGGFERRFDRRNCGR